MLAGLVDGALVPVSQALSAVEPDRLVVAEGSGLIRFDVAAIKAVADGKQVAVLAPTTLLVSQHAETFAERYAGFPVRVAQLSRFQSEAESAQVLAGLADGSIDVVVGTFTQP